MLTRRSASRATSADVTGTPSPTRSTSAGLSDRSLGKNGAPVNGIDASGVRSKKNSPKPSHVPTTEEKTASTQAISAICRGVPPASRIAANRCSRRAADSRVALPVNISTGNSRASAITDSTRSMAFAFRPTPIRQPLLLPQLFGGVAEIAVISRAPLS